MPEVRVSGGASTDAAAAPSCRFCAARLERTVIDLGMSPLCERFLDADEIRLMEPFYPLRVFACEECYLVQLEALVPPEEIFTEYAYFSSYSSSWVEHARRYVEMIAGSARARAGRLRRRARFERRLPAPAFPRLGSPRSRDRSGGERRRRLPRNAGCRRSSGSSDARRRPSWSVEGKRASLVIGNNVIAQVPDLNDFVGGVKIILRESGTATFEFPHLLRLLAGSSTTRSTTSTSPTSRS